jgi:hypothetical protein
MVFSSCPSLLSLESKINYKHVNPIVSSAMTALNRRLGTSRIHKDYQ